MSWQPTNLYDEALAQAEAAAEARRADIAATYDAIGVVGPVWEASAKVYGDQTHLLPTLRATEWRRLTWDDWHRCARCAGPAEWWRRDQSGDYHYGCNLHGRAEVR